MAYNTLAQPRQALPDPWAIKATDFPGSGMLNEQLLFAVRYALLAPSGHNAQPWLFGIDGDTIELYADRTRALPVIDPLDREMIISCGAALLNLRVALGHFGFRETLELIPSNVAPDLLARVHVTTNGTLSLEDESLFGAIPKRHTSRQRFSNRPLSPELMSALTEQAGKEGVWLRFVEGSERRAAVIDLINGGEVILWGSKHFRRELAAWVHPRRSRRHEGIPGYAQGLGDLVSLLEPTVAHLDEPGSREADKDGDAPAQCPALAVLETDDDSQVDWLATGQALERVLLRAQVDGVSASFLNQPLEVHELRSKVSDVMGKAGFPQLILRLGYGPQIKSTPRRPVEDVLFSPE
jgi:Nitroreductase family